MKFPVVVEREIDGTATAISHTEDSYIVIIKMHNPLHERLLSIESQYSRTLLWPQFYIIT